MDGLWWKTLLKWMIWGYHHFWKHLVACLFASDLLFFHGFPWSPTFFHVFPAKMVSLRPWKILKDTDVAANQLPNCLDELLVVTFPTKAWKKCKIVSVSQPNTARCKKKNGEKRDPFESLLRWNNHLLKAKLDHKRIHVFGTFRRHVVFLSLVHISRSFPSMANEWLRLASANC